MRYLPDGNQMKEADSYTIEKVGIPSLVLMERAALQIVAVMENENIDTSRALVVCGSGNNGGDGFAVARLLSEKGQKVSVLFAGSEGTLSAECRLQKEIVENLGIEIFTDLPDLEYTVIIDAVFGVGLSRGISGHYRDVIDWMNRKAGAKVAVDIPSGICAADGSILEIAFQADLTVAMACTKLGCELFPGKEYAGKTVPVSIGIDPGFFCDRTDVCYTFNPGDIGTLLPVRRQDSHKGTYGKVLMVTGSKGMSGAAFLSALAAYTAGAGLIRVYTPEANRVVLQQLLPEAVLTCYEEYDSSELDELLKWADVLCTGCGLGRDVTAEKILNHIIRHVNVPCVIDADGLNILSRHMDLLKEVKAPVILTPHMAEMARLFDKSVEEIRSLRMEIVDQFVSNYPVVCILKDSRTVVAASGRQKFVNLAGNSAMAKAGSGDVLAGVITGLLAQGMERFDAAVLGVFLHACGGDAAKKKKGSYSVLARDLIEGIGQCMAETEEGMQNRQKEQNQNE